MRSAVTSRPIKPPSDVTESLKQHCWLQTDRMHLIFSATSSGVLSVGSVWPTQQKAKIVYFARKNRDVIPRDAPVKLLLIYGDLSYSLMDHLSAFVEQVSSCLLLMLYSSY